MKLGVRVNLFSLVVPGLIALLVVLSGIYVMNRVIFDLNNKLIAKDLENITNQVESDHQVLKRAGVDDYPHYINMAKNDFLSALEKRNFNPEGDLLILDSLSDSLIYRSRGFEENIPELKKSIFPHTSGELMLNSASGRYYMAYVKIPYWNWIIFIIISTDDLFLEIYNYLKLVIPLSLIPLLAGLLISFLSLKNVFKRINDSLDCLKEVETGNLNVRIKTGKSVDEIDEIQKAINNMIESLRNFYHDLEHLVEQRTTELESTNTKLVEEIRSGEKAREEISYLNQYLKNIIDSMPSILIGINRDTTINKWNPEAARLSGLSEEQVLNKPFTDYIKNKDQITGKMIEHIEMDESFTDLHVKVNLGDSKEFSAEISYFPLREKRYEMGILQIRDITERLQLEELIKQSEKMLSVGGLAAGMAHEINNPLAGMMQSAQNIKRRLDLNIPANIKAAEQCGSTMEDIARYSEMRNIPDMVQSILDSGKQAADIVENMVSFSQQDTGAKSLHNVEEILHHTVNGLKLDEEFHNLFELDQIIVDEEYESDLPAVHCVEKKLEQAFYNILRNSLQAMATLETDDPKITLRVRKESNQLKIEIEDNGPGIDPAIEKRIFEPFFTTKEVDEGKGLGLSISYYIIRDDHGGNLWLQPKEGPGTLFGITIPLNNFPGTI